ncbi:hypothetical protein [Salipaludibacillus sp. CF4.18]|uniref:hypothetical protein n=1 Tax=Salipaludibacillus sp. CF4.18 TaxID=3373081 RepID=UPI003EE62DB2
MLGNIRTINGKESIILTNGEYQGHLNEEGYKKVEICEFDTSNIGKNYITIYFVDITQGVIKRANLRTTQTSPDKVLPLEKLIRVILKNELEGDIHCCSVELEDLIGAQCQIRIERDDSYYNITEVFPIDEELGDFISKKDIIANDVKRRLPDGIFNTKSRNGVTFKPNDAGNNIAFQK